jgi:hypothetical protein
MRFPFQLVVVPEHRIRRISDPQGAGTAPQQADPPTIASAPSLSDKGRGTSFRNLQGHDNAVRPRLVEESESEPPESAEPDSGIDQGAASGAPLVPPFAKFTDALLFEQTGLAAAYRAIVRRAREIANQR